MKTPTTPERRKAEKTSLYRRGFIVLIALVVMEFLDYFMAQLSNGSITILFVLALINAALIVQYYMHVAAIFSPKGDH